MRIGKVTQTVMQRSVLKPLQAMTKDNVLKPSAEEMCAAIAEDISGQVIVTSCSYYGNEKNLGVYAIAKAVNDLATRGANPMGVQIHIQLPSFAYESRLKSMVEHIREACKTQALQILSVQAGVNPAVISTIVYVTAVGNVQEGSRIQTGMGKPGQDIVQMNWVGGEGVLRLLYEKEKELSMRFTPSFLKQIKAAKQYLFAVEGIKYAITNGALAIHQIAEGGILTALWEMAEASGVGLEIDLRKISMRQEMIEACEFYRINPYLLTSIGSVLIVTDNGESLVLQMKNQGIHAVTIGRTTNGRDRVLYSGAEKRFLDRPQQDELVRVMAEVLQQKDNGGADD